MSKIYKSHKGKTVDMAAMRSKNQNTVAAGNMGVNARGDVVQGGVVVEQSSSRVRRQVVTQSVSTESIKDDITDAELFPEDKRNKKAQPAKKKSERELDNGDIVVSDGDDE